MSRENMMAHANLLERYFSGPVERRLSRAREIHADHGAALLARKDIARLLARLTRALARLEAQMDAMAMSAQCCECGRRTGGCCSRAMAANSDTIQLLINLLLQAKVRRHTHMEDLCCFLGSRGCVLPAKPIFCLNYNCSHIRTAATPMDMARLDHHTGQVLSRQTELETLLLEALLVVNRF